MQARVPVRVRLSASNQADLNQCNVGSRRQSQRLPASLGRDSELVPNLIPALHVQKRLKLYTRADRVERKRAEDCARLEDLVERHLWIRTSVRNVASGSR